VLVDAAESQSMIALDVPATGPPGLSIRDERPFRAADGGAPVALQRDTGAVLGSAALPGEPDVIMHDHALSRLYVAIGSPGMVSAIDDRRLDVLETVLLNPALTRSAGTPTGEPSMRFSRAARQPPCSSSGSGRRCADPDCS
jgi:hypothetical protein